MISFTKPLTLLKYHTTSHISKTYKFASRTIHLKSGSNGANLNRGCNYWIRSCWRTAHRRLSVTTVANPHYSWLTIPKAHLNICARTSWWDTALNPHCGCLTNRKVHENICARTYATAIYGRHDNICARTSASALYRRHDNICARTYATALYVSHDDPSSVALVEPDVDLDSVCSSLDKVAANLSARGRRHHVDLDEVRSMYDRWRHLMDEKDLLEEQRAGVTAQVKFLACGKGPPTERSKEELFAEGRALRERLKQVLAVLWPLEEHLMTAVLKFPAPLHQLTLDPESTALAEDDEGVVAGPHPWSTTLAGDEGGVVLCEFGARQETPFPPLSHAELGRRHGWLHRSAGSTCYVSGDLAELEFELLEGVADRLERAGLRAASVPDTVMGVVREACCADLDDMLSLQDVEGSGRGMHLVGGASHAPWAAFLARNAVPMKQLPLKFYTVSTLYTRQPTALGQRPIEKGEDSAVDVAADERGEISRNTSSANQDLDRKSHDLLSANQNPDCESHDLTANQNRNDKSHNLLSANQNPDGQSHDLLLAIQSRAVSLFAAAAPDSVETVMEECVGLLETLYVDLALRGRIVRASAGHLRACETYRLDVELWLPSEQRHVIVAWIALHGDFVSKRLMSKYVRPGGDIYDRTYLHTVHGCAMHVAGVMAAILEQRQTADGDVQLEE